MASAVLFGSGYPALQVTIHLKGSGMSIMANSLGNQIDPTVVFGFNNLPDNREREPLRIVRGKGVFVYDEALVYALVQDAFDDSKFSFSIVS